jgi:cell division transport system permease protein
MKSNSIRYLIGQGTSSLWRNRLMTLASVGVLTACLLIVGFAVLLTENINQIVGYVESQNEMVAFMYKSDEKEDFIKEVSDVDAANRETALQIQADFEESGLSEDLFRQALIDSGMTEEELKTLFGDQTIADYTPAETETEPQSGRPVVYWDELIREIQEEIQNTDNVAQVDFVSKEEGMENQKESFGDLAYLLDDYTGAENPIRNSFVIKVTDLGQMQKTLDSISEIYGIKLVNAANNVATTLISLRRIINIVGWSIVAALSIVSLVIIVNTIRASIFTRRKELNIMKYVGATNSFIRLPFIVEGICLGLLAAAVAFLIIWGGYSYILNTFIHSTSSWIESAFQSIIPFEQIAPKLAVFFVVSSVSIGVIGSAVSIRNHIKV